MRFNDSVDWELNDFAVAGILLFSAGLVLDQIITRVHGKNRKIIALGVLVLTFLYVWAELAVGVFTNLGS
jgi:hypothetical protein